MSILIEHCGECGRPNNQQKRRITQGMKQFLINLYNLDKKNPEVEYWHFRTVLTNNSVGLDYALNSRFGLIERKGYTISNSLCAGYWRITKLGIDFVEGKASVAKYLYIRLGEIVGESKEKIYIDQVGKKRFSIEELLNENEEENENG